MSWIAERRPPNRREFLDLAFKITVAAVLAGCESKIPPITPTPPPVPTEDDYWTVEYFADPNLEPDRLRGSERLKALFINSNWNSKEPVPGVSWENWSARFRRRINFHGEPHFYINHDDGAQVLIDGKPIYDDLSQSNTNDLCLAKGLVGLHEVTIIYKQNSGGDHLEFSWDNNASRCTITPIPRN